MEQGETTAVRVRIHGRVQGVCYRAWTVEEALRRGLSGWVRNRMDGTVEAEFRGPRARVAEMIAACRQGPHLAAVTDIEEVAADAAADGAQNAVMDPAPSGPGFRQIPTV